MPREAARAAEAARREEAAEAAAREEERAAQAAADRDAAIEQITPKIDTALKAQVVEQLREKLNRQ